MSTIPGIQSSPQPWRKLPHPAIYQFSTPTSSSGWWSAAGTYPSAFHFILPNCWYLSLFVIALKVSRYCSDPPIHSVSLVQNVPSQLQRGTLYAMAQTGRVTSNGFQRYFLLILLLLSENLQSDPEKSDSWMRIRMVAGQTAEVFSDQPSGLTQLS